jgi:hypothetical protein
MSLEGELVEAVVLVERDADNCRAGLYLLPFNTLKPRFPYTLLGLDHDATCLKLAHLSCVSFSRGTRITMSTGAQMPVEQLRAGDLVLTRDNGPQPLRWVGLRTVQAIGAFAPVVISAGTLSNTRDLVVSPDHRLFIYQRSDQIGAGQPDVLVKARHLVNGSTVRVRSGGYVDYFQVLLDSHHIIYAEGIAAESMLVDPRTRAALPGDAFGGSWPGHANSGPLGLELNKAALDRPDALQLLRRASRL